MDKPASWTSHDVVAKLRRIYGIRKVGHAGTLDPDATGVLLVGMGSATRLLQFLQLAGKTYRGRVAFGTETDTLDASGRVIRSCQMELTRDQVVDAARAMTGEIDQVPPMVSALKVDGRRLYEIARSGKEVERSSRKVRVRRFDIESFDAGEESGLPSATVLVECSSGTYVRSLAADLGTALGGCAHLAELRRLSVGSFTLKEARSMDEIEADPGAALKSCREAVRDLVQATASERQAMEIGHGAVFPAGTIVKDGSAGPTAVVGPDGELLAVYEGAARGDKPVVVLASASTQ